MNSQASLPQPYVEVFIWYSGARRIGRLDASGNNFQLATFLADTKSQYLVSVDQIDRWSHIFDAAANEAVILALKDCLELMGMDGYNDITSQTARDAIAALSAAGVPS